MTPDAVRAALPRLAAGGRYVLALSGGLDSTVLLHLLHSAGLPLAAVHVQHGLHPDADDWAEHCRQLCARLRVPFEERRVMVARQSELGLEAAARAARYAALRAALRPGDVLLTAHHQDDQAETVLLQLLRGAGPRGVAAMPVLAGFGEARLCRPLLGCTRAQLRQYADQHALRWVEDPSNANAAIKRSYLRQRLLPELENQWPGSMGALARSARLQAEAAELLGELARADAALCAGVGAGTLSVARLRSLSPVRQRNLLRHWIEAQALPLPAAVHLEQALRNVLAARADATPCLHWPGGELRRYRDALFAMPPLPPAPKMSLRWDLQSPLSLPAGCGRLNARRAKGKGLRLPHDIQLEIRFARGGERLRPAGSRHHRTLKQLSQTAGVPPWVRERMPLLYHAGELIAVADRWLAEAVSTRRSQTGWRLEWSGAPPGWDLPESLLRPSGSQ